MFNSILHFQQEGTKSLIKVFENYGKDFSKLAEMVYGVTYDACQNVLNRIEDIRKAILSNAFRGELASNVQDEESAVELLKSILKREA